MSRVQIDGEVHGDDINGDIFWMKFMEFVESNNWTFYGYACDMSEEEDKSWSLK